MSAGLRLSLRSHGCRGHTRAWQFSGPGHRRRPQGLAQRRQSGKDLSCSCRSTRGLKGPQDSEGPRRTLGKEERTGRRAPSGSVCGGRHEGSSQDQPLRDITRAFRKAGGSEHDPRQDPASSSKGQPSQASLAPYTQTCSLKQHSFLAVGVLVNQLLPRRPPGQPCGCPLWKASPPVEPPTAIRCRGRRRGRPPGQRLTSSRRSMLALRQGTQAFSSLFSSSSCCSLGHKDKTGPAPQKDASLRQGGPRLRDQLAHRLGIQRPIPRALGHTGALGQSFPRCQDGF